MLWLKTRRMGGKRQFESVRDLFNNGEVGSCSDINTYAVNYFSDAGTTPAEIDDPIYQINDQSGNGIDWTQATLADRPILKQDSDGLYLDFSGGKSLSCTLPAGTYTLVIAGRDGLWFDSVVSAGGAFTVGAGSYTGGPANLIPSLGDKLVGPPLLLDRVLSPAERAAYVRWLQSRGASTAEIFALLLEDGSGYLLTEDDNVIYTEAA